MGPDGSDRSFEDECEDEGFQQRGDECDWGDCDDYGGQFHEIPNYEKYWRRDVEIEEIQMLLKVVLNIFSVPPRQSTLPDSQRRVRAQGKEHIGGLKDNLTLSDGVPTSASVRDSPAAIAISDIQPVPAVSDSSNCSVDQPMTDLRSARRFDFIWEERATIKVPIARSTFE
jgi:hypothetical protein